MRSVLSKSLSAQVYDHTDLQHLISSAEVDLNPLAQLSQAAKSGRTRKIRSVIPNVAGSQDGQIKEDGACIAAEKSAHHTRFKC